MRLVRSMQRQRLDAAEWDAGWRRKARDEGMVWTVWGAFGRTERKERCRSRKTATVLLLLGLQFEKRALIVAWNDSATGLTDHLLEALGAAEPGKEEMLVQRLKKKVDVEHTKLGGLLQAILEECRLASFR